MIFDAKWVTKVQQPTVKFDDELARKELKIFER